ncbi:hypothetical protein HanIR_Chr11g0546901 [Helianthus annuus]|nr:hypothetical protein HanIR_Chr11g0546901 [Helianthus annuus]
MLSVCLISLSPLLLSSLLLLLLLLSSECSWFSWFSSITSLLSSIDRPYPLLSLSFSESFSTTSSLSRSPPRLCLSRHCNRIRKSSNSRSIKNNLSFNIKFSSSSCAICVS